MPVNSCRSPRSISSHSRMRSRAPRSSVTRSLSVSHSSSTLIWPLYACDRARCQISPKNGLSSRLGENRQLVKRATDDGSGIGAQPVAHDGAVDAPEIRAELEVANVQVAHARIAAVQPALKPAAQQEHGLGSTVIGPSGAVLFHAAAEFGEGHDYRVAEGALRLQVFGEGGQAVIQGFHEPIVGVLL